MEFLKNLVMMVKRVGCTSIRSKCLHGYIGYLRRHNHSLHLFQNYLGLYVQRSKKHSSHNRSSTLEAPVPGFLAIPQINLCKLTDTGSQSFANVHVRHVLETE
jgi:hypothetical protein